MGASARSGGSGDYLYRITSFQHVTDLFRTRKLYLANPSSWEDPFETLLIHKRTPALFAQSWCKRSVSDAMWRVYSHDREALRIRTTRAKLHALLKALPRDRFDAWLQEVRYRRPTEIRSKLLVLRQQLEEKYSLVKAKSVMFLKRDAFDYEHEVRIIVHDRSVPETGTSQRALRLAVDPHDLVESIMFDSRVDEELYQERSGFIREELAFRGSVGRSALYRLQTQLVVR